MKHVRYNFFFDRFPTNINYAAFLLFKRDHRFHHSQTLVSHNRLSRDAFEIQVDMDKGTITAEKTYFWNVALFLASRGREHTDGNRDRAGEGNTKTLFLCISYVFSFLFSQLFFFLEGGKGALSFDATPLEGGMRSSWWLLDVGLHQVDNVCERFSLFHVDDAAFWSFVIRIILLTFFSYGWRQTRRTSGEGMSLNEFS